MERIKNSRGFSKYERRAISLLRREKGQRFTRSELGFTLRQRENQTMSSLVLPSYISQLYCDIAGKDCTDNTNPYKFLDACSTCPSFRQAVDGRIGL